MRAVRRIRGRIVPEAAGHWRELSRDFTRGQRILLAVVVLCIPLVFAAPFVGFIPFRPFTFYGYLTDPPEQALCPSESVRVEVERKVENPLFGKVEEVEVETKWVARDGRLTPTVEETLPLDPVPRGKYPSRILRTAPRDPGEWGIGSKLTVRGSVLGFDRTQIIETTTEPLVRVLEIDDPECTQTTGTREAKEPDAGFDTGA